MNPIIYHYDSMIMENNDPFRDPPILRAYMDKWDGQPFIDALKIDDTKSVLEIGVGTGRLAARTSPLCKRLVGIDLAPKTINRAKENLSAWPNISLICGDFYTYEFSETFDVIYSSLTFMHLQDKEHAIEKISSLLNRNGRVVLSLEKNQQPFIDYAERKIKIWPDNPSNISILFERNFIRNIKQFETEFSNVIIAEKQ